MQCICVAARQNYTRMYIFDEDGWGIKQQQYMVHLGDVPKLKAYRF